MAGAVDIIAAGPLHAPALAALHGLSFADPAISGPAWSADAFAALLATPGVEAFILCLEDRPSALALWRHVLDEGELLTIGTDPAVRGRGLAGRLLRHGMSHLKACGVARLYLEVAVTNTTALALYASHGFTNAGRRRHYYKHAGQSIDADVMVTGL